MIAAFRIFFAMVVVALVAFWFGFVAGLLAIFFKLGWNLTGGL